jgi:dTDP-4-amino-4,6-dideoxygalactose transaminase
MIKQVPFFRPSIGDAEITAVVESLRSGWLTSGPHVSAFEKEFSSFIGENVYAVAVNSATAALHLGLEALGVGPGDEVVLPTLTFTATAEVVKYLGATPVFVDIDSSTLCIDIHKLEAAITPSTKVIMPVHFAGNPCAMSELRSIADIHNLSILDDAAHALPSYHAGKIIGSRSSGADVTAFSFYANKTMTTGEGGMLVTSNSDIASRARTMRLHGIDRDVFDRFTNINASWVYDIISAGFKYNLTDYAAAMGRVQLSRLTEFQQARERLALKYNRSFVDLPIKLPPMPSQGDMHSWHLYIIQIDPDAGISRDDFILELQKRNVATSVHYRPLHQMTYWKKQIRMLDYSSADEYFDRCVSLPLFMSMSDEEQLYVIEAVKGVLS